MRLSVIIPVYNQEELVVKAIESVPVRDDIEIIVIDDCSTDRTLAVLLDMTRENMTVLHNEVNKGVGYTVNRGYDVAKGEYIVLLGSDDYFLPEILDVLEQANGQDLVYFNLRKNDGSLIELSKDNREGFCGSVKLMRREFVGDTRNPEIRRQEDLYFFQKLVVKNPTELYTGITAKHYNFPREGSLSQL